MEPAQRSGEMERGEGPPRPKDVRPEWRHRGLGRRLLAHLARTAIDRGCGRMEWAVLNWNETALRVYRAIGGVPQTEWTVQRLTGPALAALAAAG